MRTDSLDNRNMVADFSDIKRIVKGWIDRELDHKMILRHDDPLVAPLRALGEPMYLLESNPTVERIAKLIFDKGRELGVDIVTVRVWETPSSFASYGGTALTCAATSLLPERQLVREVENRRCRVSSPTVMGMARSRRSNCWSPSSSRRGIPATA